MKSLVLCLVVVVVFGSCLKLPSSFKKCDRRSTNFNQCLSKSIHGALTSLEKPLKSHGLPSLHDVLFPPAFGFEIGNSTYGLKQKCGNLRLFGLSNPENVAARMNFGPVVSTLTVETTYSELKWTAEWEVQGTMVLLPLNVVTAVEAILVEPVLTIIFDLEEYEKGGTHFRVAGTGIDLQARDFVIDYKRLFSNERLNREFNSALVEKSSEIFAMFKHLEKIYAPAFGSMLNGFLEKVPVAELFDG